MFVTLLLIGLACLLAAVVGGGISIKEITIPAIRSRTRQVLLGLVGVASIVVALQFYRPETDERPSGVRASADTTDSSPPSSATTTPSESGDQFGGYSVVLVHSGNDIESHDDGDGWTVTLGGDAPALPGGGVRLDCLFRGDFDVSVKYALNSQWQFGNGGRVALSGGGAAIDRISDADPRREAYVFIHPNGEAPAVATADTTGELRLARKGSFYTGMVRSGATASWTSVGSAAATDTSVELSMNVFESTRRPERVVASFSDLHVLSGSCR